jgi:hypothetical protein
MAQVSLPHEIAPRDHVTPGNVPNWSVSCVLTASRVADAPLVTLIVKVIVPPRLMLWVAGDFVTVMAVGLAAAATSSRAVVGPLADSEPCEQAIAKASNVTAGAL